MIFKLLTYTSLLFCNVPKNTFKKEKVKRKLNGLVEIHHIIPRQFRNHPTIRLSKYSIENGYNLMFLPTTKGKDILKLHHDRPIHNKGHIAYNNYVKNILDEMYLDFKVSENNLCELNKRLKQNGRHINIPW